MQQRSFYDYSNLEILIDGIQDLIYVTDAKRKIKFANSAFANIFGFSSKEEIIGMPISNLYVNPEHRKLFESEMINRGGELINYFVLVKHNTGYPFYLSVDSNRISHDENLGIQGTGRNLTALIDFLGAFFQTNIKGYITFCSKDFSELFRLKGPEYIIGGNILTLFNKNDISELFEIGNDNKLCTIEAKYCGKNKLDMLNLKLYYSTIYQYINGEKKAIGFQGTLEDITEIEKNRQELDEKQKIHELLWSMSQDGIYVIQGDRIKTVNKSFCELVKYNEKEILSFPFINLIHPEDHKQVENEVSLKLLGEDRGHYEFRIITKHSEVRIVRAQSGFCTINKIPSVYGYLRDLTDEKKHEEEMQKEIKKATAELNELLEFQKDLLETVVHEMDSPTVAIRGLVDILKDGISKGYIDKDRQLLKLNNIDELCQLIFLLKTNFNIAESKKELKDIARDWVVIENLIYKAFNYLKPLLRNKCLSEDHISIHLLGIPKYVYANSDLLTHVFFNLFSNAIKYSKNDPNLFKIEILSEYNPKKGLSIYFRDWGIGIPKGESQLIFKKRLKASNAINYPGMGLGLTVSNKILEGIGCKIWLETFFNPTTFILRFPNDIISFEYKRGG